MIKPKQKLSELDRYAVDEVTGLNNIEQTAEHFIASASRNNRADEMDRLYRMLGDYINEEDYAYVLNPFNTSVKKYTRFRGRLRNFNIVAPVVEMHLSEFGRRGNYPEVVQSHPDDPADKQAAWMEVLMKYRGQLAVNKLAKMGVVSTQPQQELPPIEQVKEDFERSYKQERLVSGQDALDYLMIDLDVADMHINCYRDYLTTGHAITYKGVHHDDVINERVYPGHFWFPHSINKPRIEDRDWAVRYMPMTPNQLLDFHGSKLSDELINKLYELESQHKLQGDFNSKSTHIYMSDEDFNKSFKYYYQGEEGAVDHYHVVYKAFKRVAVLTYENLIGKIKEMDVEDSYKLDKSKGDISIEYKYINALYEAFKVEFNDIVEYIDAREIPYDRAAINNRSKVKLPYNGIASLTEDGEIKSLVKSSINYQTIFNVLKYSFETTINKNKDKIAVIPLGLLNKGQQGWDEDKAMYYAEANSTLFVDETSPSAALALQGIKVLDMSLGKYVSEIYNHAQMVKQEWWDLVGFNRQRFGDTMASDGKAVTEQAIFRSALITENLLRPFEQLQKSEYAGLLDISKLAWINGKKGQYAATDGQKKLFEINDDNYMYYLSSDMDIHTEFSSDNERNREDLKSYLFNATQNGMSMIPVLESMEKKSFAKMKEIIVKEEKAREAMELKEASETRASNERIAQMNKEAAEIQSEDKRYVADKQYDGVVEAAAIKADADNDDSEALLALAQAQHTHNIDEREQVRKEEETASQIKKDEADTKKTQKETALMKNEPVKTNN